MFAECGSSVRFQARLALPQKVQVYRACWVISIWREGAVLQFQALSYWLITAHTFFTCLRREAP